MSKQFIRVLCNIDCEWESFQPIYRTYVNDELFAERAWRWTEHYLEELIQIEAEPGEYTIFSCIRCNRYACGFWTWHYKK